MFGKIGAVMVAVGIMSADSIDIMVPALIVFAGMLLVAIDEVVRGSKNE